MGLTGRATFVPPSMPALRFELSSEAKLKLILGFLGSAPAGEIGACSAGGVGCGRGRVCGCSCEEMGSCGVGTVLKRVRSGSAGGVGSGWEIFGFCLGGEAPSVAGLDALE